MGVAAVIKPFDMLLLALATWRIAAMITRGYGPFGVFRRWQHWSASRWLEVRRKAESAGGDVLPHYSFGECVKCMSVWVAILLLGLYFVAPAVARVVVAWFAISGAALMLASYSGADHV